MNPKIIRTIAILIMAVILSTGWKPVQAQTPSPTGATALIGSAFTYQGRLQDAAGPTNGTCDFQFSLFASAGDSDQVGVTLERLGVTLADGYFTVPDLDFEPGAFNGEARWLAVSVRCPAGTGTYEPLTPRQALTAAPYALYTLAAPWSGLANIPAGFADGVDNDTTYSAGWGLGLSGTEFSADRGLVQQRVAGLCPEGSAIRVVNLDGTVTCEPVASAVHDHWGETWSGDSTGTGLTVVGGDTGAYGLGNTTGLRGYASAASGAASGVFGSAASTGGTGVAGSANATTGFTIGVSGVSGSDQGTGVYGLASSASGGTYGVWGVSNSPDGYGVHGVGNTGVYGESEGETGPGVLGTNSSVSGIAPGVRGATDSSSGVGIYGIAFAGLGTTSGVYGISVSTEGRGVSGYASAATGAAFGVYGESDSTAGRGVYGYTNASTGTTYGVYGRSLSPGGRGVYGWASATGDAAPYGVYGRSDADQGRGVFGYATATSGENYGVRGVSDSPSGYGVYGWNTSNEVFGNGLGVYGRTSSTWNGSGVYGWASASTGSPQGVSGRSDSTHGSGVYGWASTLTGENYGVRGHTGSPDGYGGYFQGRLYADADIDLAATPANHVALVRNTATGDSPDVLALQVGYAGDPGVGINFVTFFKGDDTAVGAIEGNGSGGVTYKSGAADFAEFLPRLNAEEAIEPGDLVGVFAGRVTRATHGADQVLAVSRGPLVLGNDPGDEQAGLYEQVAFLGQVTVRVRGPVAAGDLIVPSGLEDGTGVAISPEALTPDQFAQAVGQAWESSAELGIKQVLVAVGLLHHDPTAMQMSGRIEALEARLDALEKGSTQGQAPAQAQSAIWMFGLLAVTWLVGRRIPLLKPV